MEDVLVVGGGIFGVTTALELRKRGHRVALLDPGPLPYPLAASTDISKVIRMEYGPDAFYMALMEEALTGWRSWNQQWEDEGQESLFHETGVLMVCRDPMAPGGFEYESWQLLNRRGHTPERIDENTLAVRFPAWSTGQYRDGFFHAQGGYAESGRVVAALAAQARRTGVRLLEGRRMTALIEEKGRVTGVRTSGGESLPAGAVVLATGAWTAQLRPDLSEALRPTGHVVFHLRPEDPLRFAEALFPTFTGDVARTGYYGFPLSRDGVVKIGCHGPGILNDPDAPRNVTQEDHDLLRAFLADTFPALADAPIVYTRRCSYADTQDEDFWIANDPERAGLTVAGGGSGHGFKFAPSLGALIADTVEGHPRPDLDKFRWRPELRLEKGREAARFHGA